MRFLQGPANPHPHHFTRSKWEVWIIVYYTNIKHSRFLITVISITALSLLGFYKYLTVAVSWKATFWFKNRRRRGGGDWCYCHKYQFLYWVHLKSIFTHSSRPCHRLLQPCLLSWCVTFSSYMFMSKSSAHQINLKQRGTRTVREEENIHVQKETQRAQRLKWRKCCNDSSSCPTVADTARTRVKTSHLHWDIL